MNNEDIKQAFERMTPDKDTRARILTQILAATDEQREQTNAGYAKLPSHKTEALKKVETKKDALPVKRTNVSRETFGKTSVFGQIIKPSHPQLSKKKRSTWVVALPIAACLVFIVGVGFFAANILPFGDQTQKQPVAQIEALSESTDNNADDENSEDSFGLSDGPENTESSKNSLRDSSTDGPENSTDGAPPPTIASTPGKLSRNYPFIETDQLGRLCIIDEGNTAASIAEPSRIGSEIGRASAQSSDGVSTTTCTLYEYEENAAKYYAVLYEGDTSYYLASPLAW